MAESSENAAAAEVVASEDAAATPVKSVGWDWLADVVLLAGFLSCAGVAVGWMPAPFGAAASGKPPLTGSKMTTDGGRAEDSDPRFGTWISPAGNNSRWIRSARISSAGVYGLRIALSVDFIGPEGLPIPGVLGEYTGTALLQPDGKAQAGTSDHSCQIRLEWADGALQVRHVGPCGEAGNLAAGGVLSGSYRKLTGDARTAALPPQDCGKTKNAEEQLFCKDPALRIAREVTAAVSADALAAFRLIDAAGGPAFEQAAQNWQAEVRRVCMTTDVIPEDRTAGRSACFSQSYDARVNWLRLHTGLIHLAVESEKEESVRQRYHDALSTYLDTYGALALQLPMLAKQLRGLLGPKDTEYLETAMTNRGPRGGLFQMGCGPMGCELQEGAFEVDATGGRVTVALRRGQTIDVFSINGEAQGLPPSVHEWLQSRSTRVHEINYKP